MDNHLMPKSQYKRLMAQGVKGLTTEQIKQAIEANTYGGKPVTMEMKGGVSLGLKTNQ
jgi:hypothetical protein